MRQASKLRVPSRRCVLQLLAALGPMVVAEASLAAPSGPYALKEIAPGVFVHRGVHGLFSPQNQGDIANAGFVVGRDSVAAIDSGGSARTGEALRAAIRSVTAKPVRFVINTHMHPDHVFGNAGFEADAPEFVGHHKLKRALGLRSERYLENNGAMLGPEALAGTKVILPTRAVEDEGELDLGGRVLALAAHPTAHTDNDLSILDRETGTLFLGDLLFSEHIPTIDGSIRGWLALLQTLKLRSAARAVPGHGPETLGWPDGVRAEEDYLSGLAEEIRALVKDGRTLADALQRAGQSHRHSWQMFDEFHARNVTTAFAELEWE